MEQKDLDRLADLIINKVKDIHENPYKYLKDPDYSEIAKKYIKDEPKKDLI